MQLQFIIKIIKKIYRGSSYIKFLDEKVLIIV